MGGPYDQEHGKNGKEWSLAFRTSGPISRSSNKDIRDIGSQFLSSEFPNLIKRS